MWTLSPGYINNNNRLLITFVDITSRPAAKNGPSHFLSCYMQVIIYCCHSGTRYIGKQSIPTPAYSHDVVNILSAVVDSNQKYHYI